MTKNVYLTIDDGPSTQFREKLAFLDEQGIKAIWFCLGNNMEKRPDMVIDAIQAGHVIGNHTYTHPHCSELTADQCFAEIHSTHILLEKLYKQAGVVWDKKYFRFPFGDDGSDMHIAERWQNNIPLTTPGLAQAIQDCLRQLGYVQANFEGITYPFFLDYMQNRVDVFATYDSQDWRLPQNSTDEDRQTMMDALLNRMDAHKPEGSANLNDDHSSVVLGMHDHAKHLQNLVLFKQMVLKMLDKGFTFALPR